jgi:hypothetical protein
MQNSAMRKYRATTVCVTLYGIYGYNEGPQGAFENSANVR